MWQQSLSQMKKPVHDKGEVCETIILSFNGEILKRLVESEEVYPGGYLKSINGQHPWYIYGQGPSKPGSYVGSDWGLP